MRLDTNNTETQMLESDRRNHEMLPAPVYHVQSDLDSSVLVGMKVQISGGGWISWFDTVKKRRMRGEVLENSPGRFSFKRDEGDSNQIYSFVPMTLDIYNSLVKGGLVGSPEFADQQSMVDAFKGLIENA